MEVCLFCNQEETSYQPETEFVCGKCVVLLVPENYESKAHQEDLKKAREKAVRMDLTNKVKALDMFIIPKEEPNVKPDKSIERNLDRTRTDRPIRRKKRLYFPPSTES